MYFGEKRSRKKTGMILSGVLLAVFLLILSLVTIDAVMAYMFKQTKQITNTLEPATVSADVVETFDGQRKENVFIHNTGNIPVYVRVILVEYWTKDGAYVSAPEGSSVTITKGTEDWLEIGGMYYYNKPLPVDGNTTNLLNSVTATIPDGYQYHMDVYVEAIQAEPVDAVSNAWGVTIVNGMIQ